MIVDSGKPMHFYTTQKISGKRSKTPEGYLLIEGVPLARTGMMIYGPHEVPIPPGPDGLVYVERTPEQVFRLETVASANGKDVVNDHPSVDVSPQNWRELSHGTVMNPRRGVGIEDDFLIGDILVKSQEGIELVDSGKVELSMGYDSGYVMTGPGRGYQKNIIYNHVALVDKGRCGPRCSIGDRQYIQEKDMTDTKDRVRTTDRGRSAVRRMLDRIVRTAKTNDEELLEETLGDAEKELEKKEPQFDRSGDESMAEKDDDKKTEDTVRKAVRDAMADAMKPVLDAIDARFKDVRDDIEDLKEAKAKGKDRKGRGHDKDDGDDDDDDDKNKDNEKILGALELEAPPGTNDRESVRKARDSSFLADSFQETVALAEVLAPGIRVPTFDRALTPAKSYDTICNLRRTTLDIAYHTADGRGIVDDVGGGQYKTMDCMALRSVFMAAGALKKAKNNGGGAARTTDVVRPGGSAGGSKMTLADINKKNAEFYGRKVV